ncbi:hypothetical protein LNQ03_25585 [Klebsiella pneumoniae subsp. pneumoniae]|nr:hypothetical protein [Klebsiella pneumoniae subsp. pneumoniae]
MPNIFIFADLNAPLSADDRERLARLLQYGPSLSSHTPTGKLLLVTPRPGTISPWSSKATDIAHNCGLAQVVRLERGVAYYVEASTLTGSAVDRGGGGAARPHDGERLRRAGSGRKAVRSPSADAGDQR